MARLTELPSPAVFVDLDIAERNLRLAAARTAAAGMKHRPHIKTHKSVYFAKKQLEYGAQGITVAKLAEAEVMVAHGIDDILIAFPLIGEEKLRRLQKLHNSARMTTIVDSLEGARGLNTVGTAEKPLPVLIDIDCGVHRSGVQPGAAVSFVRELQQLGNLDVVGLATYNGLRHPTLAERVAKAETEARILGSTAAMLRAAGINVSVLSGGSTPALAMLDKLPGITEIRAGNYIFNDVATLAIGVAGETDCALRVLATVVSTPLPGYAAVDAGSKTLTSDSAAKVNREGFGYVVGKPGIAIEKLNEEHGYLRYDPGLYNIQVGDRIEIIPNHSCVLPNLCDFIYGVRAGMVERQIAIEARGKNY
jgi:D-serine deaminase-like pyridoxal phosphate-dependent protein